MLQPLRSLGLVVFAALLWTAAPQAVADELSLAGPTLPAQEDQARADASLVMGPGSSSDDVALRVLGNASKRYLLDSYSSSSDDVLVTMLTNGSGSYLVDGFSTSAEDVLFSIVGGGSKVYLLKGYSDNAVDVLFTIVTNGNTTYLVKGHSTSSDDVAFTAVRSGSKSYLLSGYSTSTDDVLHTVVRSTNRTYLLAGYSTSSSDVHHTVVPSGSRAYVLDGYSVSTDDVVANWIGLGLDSVGALAVDRRSEMISELATPTRRLALATAGLPPQEQEDDDLPPPRRLLDAETLMLLSLANWQHAEASSPRGTLDLGPLRGELAVAAPAWNVPAPTSTNSVLRAPREHLFEELFSAPSSR